MGGRAVRKGAGGRTRGIDGGGDRNGRESARSPRGAGLRRYSGRKRRRLGAVLQKPERAWAVWSETGGLGRSHGIESGGAQGVEGGMAALQGALLSQRAGACAQAQPGRSERGDEGGVRTAGRKKRQGQS